MSQNYMDVQEFIDQIRFGKIQKLILLLCFCVVAIDGFDTASIGFIAPALKHDWGLLPTELAALFASGLMGLMLGALIFGPLADRFGRKTMLVLCIFLFGCSSLASAFSPEIQTLIFLRLLTGIGLGGAMPTAITLMSEYCPSARRSVLVMTMFCGFTIGSALGGMISARLIPMIGWQGILFMGGILPLILLPAFYFLVPESLRFKVLKRHSDADIQAIIKRLAPELCKQLVLESQIQKKNSSSIRELLSRKYWCSTLLIWTTYFMSLMIIYLIASWMPTLLTNIGASLEHASLVTAVFQIGGTLGSISLGYLMDKWGADRILSAVYMLGALFVIFSGLSTASLFWLILSVFIVGLCISGGQTGLNAYTAVFYPTHCRATGVSWANAIGRCGSVLGSFVGGWLMSFNLDISVILSLLALPALLAALSLWVLRRNRQSSIL
ncbi:AAHS family 4-hydroxybenzoate transporter-like MFS transporter [Acinetobacter baylyi]|uniref:AAHS family 4-hydroxybenzoate transporter-like MFS transporter n=1 Tax=Acinetobacter baylyi TaxID=202950 RepID=A0ABU0UYK7_ACIBI|nr:MFS transporter [Acinetobacter baylyi]MDQ1209338.1 AAHS family 4-hydroxybenzoate transporter-like MFS transporter [Acinetobacter baylyi]MDR6107069.1 AAHS family 4-hydroxybenzoate transporter-like MFS transporter [Acinetobacter baylyi]MDR6186210.1 AAHS family 4-hydroxybenzoate transporter-like MFS transporter [Acinetobacter baylyi]